MDNKSKLGIVLFILLIYFGICRINNSSANKQNVVRSKWSGFCNSNLFTIIVIVVFIWFFI